MKMKMKIRESTVAVGVSDAARLLISVGGHMHCENVNMPNVEISNVKRQMTLRQMSRYENVIP